MDDHPSMAVYLWRASSWFHDQLEDELRARGVVVTSHTQGQVFGCIALGETRPSRLARSIGVSPQAMSQILAGMVGADFLSLDPDPQDARARVVSLTKNGVAHLRIVREVMRGLEGKLEERFGKPVIDVIRMVLERQWDDQSMRSVDGG